MTVTHKQRTNAQGIVQKYYYVEINFASPTGPRIRHRKRLYNSTRRDAEQYERNRWSEILRGEYGRKEEQHVPTLNDFASDFMKHYGKVHNKPSEQRNKEMHLRLHLAMRGAPQKAIQDLMGHATAEMTNRYMHLSPDARREAVQLLDNFSSTKGTSASSGDEQK